MAKDNLETKAKKAVLKIANKVSEMNNSLNDLNLKLCHLIKRGTDYYSYPSSYNYY